MKISSFETALIGVLLSLAGAFEGFTGHTLTALLLVLGGICLVGYAAIALFVDLVNEKDKENQK